MLMIRSGVCMGLSLGVFMICRVLQVPFVLPVLLTAWGSICFMFAEVFAGGKTRMRDGVEEKVMLYIYWLIAGVICLVLAGGYIYWQS